MACRAPSSTGRCAPIVRPASRAGISSAEARLVSTGSILLLGLCSVKASRQVLSTRHQIHSVAQGCADDLQGCCDCPSGQCGGRCGCSCPVATSPHAAPRGGRSPRRGRRHPDGETNGPLCRLPRGRPLDRSSRLMGRGFGDTLSRFRVFRRPWWLDPPQWAVRWKARALMPSCVIAARSPAGRHASAGSCLSRPAGSTRASQPGPCRRCTAASAYRWCRL